MSTVVVSGELLRDTAVARHYLPLLLERGFARMLTAKLFHEEWEGPRQELERIETGITRWDRRIYEDECDPDDDWDD